jgi:hypothetical protein
MSAPIFASSVNPSYVLSLAVVLLAVSGTNPRGPALSAQSVKAVKSLP